LFGLEVPLLVEGGGVIRLVHPSIGKRTVKGKIIKKSERFF